MKRHSVLNYPLSKKRISWILSCIAVALLLPTTPIAAFAPVELFASPRRTVPPFSSSTLLHSKSLQRGVEIDVSASDVLSPETRDRIEAWIRQRSQARWRGDYATADAVRDKLMAAHLLPAGLSLVIEDISRAEGGGSHWRLVYDEDDDDGNAAGRSEGPTVLQHAHAALGLAVMSSQTHRDCSSQLDEIVHQVMRRLEGWIFVHTRIGQGSSTTTTLFECTASYPEQTRYWLAVERELRGRKAADAAFWFAIAGVDRQDLYEILLRIGIKELQRFGHRPSCRIKDVWAVVDRFAAAGIRPPGDPVIDELANLLGEKTGDHAVSVEVAARWDLHADACALLVWKFSTRQRKQRDFLASAARHWQSRHSSNSITNMQLKRTSYDWKEVFKEPDRPLVIDIGCGMGISLLGIASAVINEEEWHPWAHCNFLGVDLSPLAIGYGQGISRRWEYEDCLHFIVDTAERALTAVHSSYPGPVSQILIQFPTPYRLLPSNSTASDYQGNTQLPKNAEEGFMVSQDLLTQAASLLQKSQGTLLLQSNCEDVAIHMYKTAQRVGMMGVPSEYPRMTMPVETTQRTDTWLSQHSESPERAMGSIWWNGPVLPQTCQTETEIACDLNGTPVHRCLLTLTSEST